jgi:hypothetical protein
VVGFFWRFRFVDVVRFWNAMARRLWKFRCLLSALLAGSWPLGLGPIPLFLASGECSFSGVGVARLDLKSRVKNSFRWFDECRREKAWIDQIEKEKEKNWLFCKDLLHGNRLLHTGSSPPPALSNGAYCFFQSVFLGAT